jgi:hypothetical protein
MNTVLMNGDRRVQRQCLQRVWPCVVDALRLSTLHWMSAMANANGRAVDVPCLVDALRLSTLHWMSAVAGVMVVRVSVPCLVEALRLSTVHWMNGGWRR